MPEIPVVLQGLGLRSWSEVPDLDLSDLLLRMDERGAPLHPGDAVLAVLVLKSVEDLRETTAGLASASQRLHRATIVLAALAVAVGVGQLVAALS